MIETGWISIVPPLLAIILALITKEVYSSLFLGVLSGMAIYVIFAQEPFIAVFSHLFDMMAQKIADNSYMIIFLALLVMLWWFFQLACIETLIAIGRQLAFYRDKRMADHVNEYRKTIDFVTGPERDKLLMPATWFYDLVRMTLIPVLALISIPFCLRMALGIFDVNVVKR